MMMDIVIFRHGQTDWNIEGRLQGSTDIELNQIGQEQAKRLGDELLRFDFDLIVSSDLSRAHATAQAVADKRKIKIIIDSRLRELGLGEAEGKTRAEIETLWGIEDLKKYNFPGRESAESVRGRLNDVVSELYAKSHQCVAISSHGGVVWDWLSQFVSSQEIGAVGNTDAFHLQWHGDPLKTDYLGRISSKKN